jgi:hypothetical protein
MNKIENNLIFERYLKENSDEDDIIAGMEVADKVFSDELLYTTIFTTGTYDMMVDKNLIIIDDYGALEEMMSYVFGMNAQEVSNFVMSSFNPFKYRFKLYNGLPDAIAIGNAKLEKNMIMRMDHDLKEFPRLRNQHLISRLSGMKPVRKTISDVFADF